VTLAPGTAPARGEDIATRAPARPRGAARTSTVRAPCIERGCHACCLDTEMPLTEEDLGRLLATGRAAEEVSVTAADGGMRLAQHRRGPLCGARADGRCSAYEARPEGCTLYPLVLDEASGDVVVDQVCPHAGAVGTRAGTRTACAPSWSASSASAVRGQVRHRAQAPREEGDIRRMKSICS